MTRTSTQMTAIAKENSTISTRTDIDRVSRKIYASDSPASVLLILESAMARKIPLDARGPDGLTLLHYVAMCGDLACMQLLQESGISPLLLDGAKRTASDVARTIEIGNYLREWVYQSALTWES
jgi:ankyrin repeat protein